jgi:cytochrome c oxidase accessory protein FixG
VQSGERIDVVDVSGFGPQDLYQKREKIITRNVDGTFQRLRYYTGWPLLAGYFGLPWLNWGGRQAVLFDLPARQFHIFDLTIWPQDLWLLGWGLMLSAFGLFTITTLVGRLWCGYTCPQTVWTAIFMWVEQVTEGPRHQRVRLNKAPWTWDKIRKRGSKHIMWLGVAALTGLTFVGYFTPIRGIIPDMLSFSANGWAVFWAAFFTGATYVNAGWAREQVCIYMCPYARFQSAMIDKDTLIVAYDAQRGEPRGSRKRGSEATGLGDCIDCELCVQVCPTGIDIRNGLQYQCIGCAHCVDACDQVMAKMSYEPGLVRYATENELAGRAKHWLRFRSVGYATACAVVAVALVTALFLRSPFAFDVIRERGELYHTTSAGLVRNEYAFKVMNKSANNANYELAVVRPDSIELRSASDISVAAGGIEDLPLQLIAKPGLATVTTVSLRLCQKNTDRCVEEETSFISPSTASAASDVGGR